MSERTPYAQEQYARAELWIPSILAREPGITSADSAYQYLRDNGQYVPRQWVREAWSETIRGAGYTDLINRLGERDVVPAGWMTGTEWNYTNQYNYIVKLTGSDSVTGVPIEQRVTISSNDLLSVGEVIGDAVNSAFQYGIEISGADFSAGIEMVKTTSW